MLLHARRAAGASGEAVQCTLNVEDRDPVLAVTPDGEWRGGGGGVL